jgi:3-isopropylmalate/(R)-2-methylmalate dehydratase small subunit
MTPFTSHTGSVASIPRANIDTDQIIPKQFLKRVERTGYGPALFFDWRYRSDGSPDPGFELNRPKAAGATILLAGPNFGCGSSREHAPWALGEYGFRAILSESFADIFFSNCCQNGILPVILKSEEMAELFRREAASSGPYRLTVDLGSLLVRDDAGFSAGFTLDDYRREALLEGLDEIGRTLKQEPEILEFERRRGRLHHLLER